MPYLCLKNLSKSPPDNGVSLALNGHLLGEPYYGVHFGVGMLATEIEALQ